MNKFSLLCLAFFSLISISKNCYAYSLYYAGEIDSRVYNEAWGEFFDKQIKVYAGGTKEKATVRIKFEMNLSEFDVDFNFNYKDDQSLKNNQYYNNFLYSLNKSIEWSQIAKDNNAETQKRIKVDICQASLNYAQGGVYCEATFFSANQGNQTDFILLVEETGEYSLNEDRYYINLNNQKKFKQLLENEVKVKIIHSIEQAEKSSNLFN